MSTQKQKPVSCHEFPHSLDHFLTSPLKPSQGVFLHVDFLRLIFLAPHENLRDKDSAGACETNDEEDEHPSYVTQPGWQINRQSQTWFLGDSISYLLQMAYLAGFLAKSGVCFADWKISFICHPEADMVAQHLMGFLKLLPRLTLGAVPHIFAEEAAHQANLLRRENQAVYVLGVCTFLLQCINDWWKATKLLQ